LGARGVEAARGLVFFTADFAADFGADLDSAFGGLAFCAPAGLAGLRTEASAASTFCRASFAARFSILNDLRACLSVAFASRTLVLAAAARAVALVAATLSSFTLGDWMVIYGNTRVRN